MDSQTSNNTLQGGDELDFIELVGSYLDGQLTPGELASLNGQLRSDDACRETFVRYCLQGKLLAEALLAGIPLPTDEPPTKTPSPPAMPTFGILGSALHGTAAYFSSGWPVAYLVATVVLGLGLLIGFVVHVSEPQVARQSTLPSPSGRGARGEGSGSGNSSLPSSSSFVGRITGMVDCQWEKVVVSGQWSVASEDSLPSPASGRGAGGEGSLQFRSPVRLGDIFALSSGLLEITYDTGAKVILQGPCTYEIESPATGFLSVGKLTARVEKKEEGRTKNEELPDSRSSFLIPHSYFAVRTPTATVTDLGTEFGVEVIESGSTTASVFQGRIEVRPMAEGEDHADAIRLGENESVRVEKNKGKCAIVVGASAQPANFVRKLVKPTIKMFDLVDVVAGGDGFSSRRNAGIDPTNGRTTDTWPPPEGSHPLGDGKYHGVEALPFVDGVFIPCGRLGPVQLDSSGHVFSEFSSVQNQTAGPVWAGGVIPAAPPLVIRTRLQGIDYASSGHGVLWMHANKGITFDLEAIRRANPGCKLLRFRAVAGNTELASAKGEPVFADIWVFVDGQVRFRRREISSYNGAFSVVISIGDKDRFLTLAATDGGNGINADWTMFGDPRLDLVTVEPAVGATSPPEDTKLGIVSVHEGLRP